MDSLLGLPSGASPGRGKLSCTSQDSKWIAAILVVTFDLELGQAVEYIYPSKLALPAALQKNICFLSFPDSNSGGLGDCIFYFRCPYQRSCSTNDIQKANSSTQLAMGSHRAASEMKLNTPLAPNSNSTDLSSAPNSPTNKSKRKNKRLSYYGCSYFRQVQDDSLKRGYYQKSVVVISRSPLYGLLKRLSCLIAPHFFENGPELLEIVYKDIQRWPPFKPGKVDLPIMGNNLSCVVPDDLNQMTNFLIGGLYYANYSPMNELSVSQTCNIFSCFPEYLISEIFFLWELIITGEPILVISTTPVRCSAIVLALVSLIAPLQFGSDYRPFFTIHDDDCQMYTKCTPIPRIILGVTNPYFEKICEKWPHIIRALDVVPKPATPTGCSPSEGRRLFTSGYQKKNGIQSTMTPIIEKNKELNIRLRNLDIYKTTASLRLNLPKSRSEQTTLSGARVRSSFDEPLDILGTSTVDFPSMQSNSQQQSDSAKHSILRQQLSNLTQAFMQPLESYFSSLLPLQKEISPFKPLAELKSFRTTQFLENLKEIPHGLKVSSRSSMKNLYARFLGTNHFKRWLDIKTRDARKRLKALFLKQILDVNCLEYIKNRPEVEIVDLLILWKNIINKPDGDVTNDVYEKVTSQTDVLISNLPSDLQNSLFLDLESSDHKKAEKLIFN